MGTKITSMSSGAIDPIAQSKRVFFRPDSTTDVLKVGYAVCYNSDLAGDHKERGVGSDPPGDHLGGDGTDYAEGNQTYTGRMFIVEKPASGNLTNFAGIVKCLGPKAGADGDMIEIWVPNGAMLPCYVEAVCANRVTALSLKAGSYYLNDDGYNFVGLAQEAIDRTTAGICWVKVDRSLPTTVGGPGTTVELTALSGDVILHKLWVKSLSTTGSSIKAVHFSGSFEGTGTGGCHSGFLNVSVDLKAASCVSHIVAIQGQARVKGSAELTAVLSASMNLTGVQAFAGCPYGTYATLSGNVYALHCKLMTATVCTGTVAQIYFEHTGLNDVDYLFKAYDRHSIGGHLITADPTPVGNDIAIPVRIGATTYYLIATADDGV